MTQPSTTKICLKITCLTYLKLNKKNYWGQWVKTGMWLYPSYPKDHGILWFHADHNFILHQGEGDIGIRSSHSFVPPFIHPSVRSFTTFSGFCAFADKSLRRDSIKIGMLLYPDDLPSADVDADGYCHFMHSPICLTIRGIVFEYCIYKSFGRKGLHLACWCTRMTYYP